MAEVLTVDCRAMPFPWPIPPAETLVIQERAPAYAVVQEQRIDEDLVVRWKRQVATANPRVVTFSEGVEATYGPTMVVADRLVLYMDEKRGEAVGNVRLTDPEGVVTATHLTFSWKDRTGTAQNVRVEASEVTLTAREIQIEPERWVLLDATGTPCHEQPASFILKSPRVVIQPGRAATVTRARISLFGANLPPLPTQRVSLDPRSQGFQFPSISYRKGAGFGLNWQGSFLLDDQTSISSNFTVYPRTSAGYAAQVSQSFLPPDRSSQLLAPRSELRERFSNSYFENVAVRSTSADRDYIRAARDTLSLGTSFNETPSGRDQEARYTKPLELAYERSGESGGVAFLGQARLQTIKRESSAVHTRGVAQISLYPRPLEIGRGLEAHTRLDASAFGGGSSFGWARAQAGVLAKPSSMVTLSASAFFADQYGRSLFPADELTVLRGVSGRVDLDFGPTRISILELMDLDRRRSFDTQYSLTQVVGCFDAYAIYRRSSNDYRFGLRLRVDQFLETLKRRKVTRSAPPPPAAAHAHRG